MIIGTQLEAKFARVVDGDTIRVLLPGAEKEESLRILSLDTEESYSAGRKPVTPWGKAAKARAEKFFKGAKQVTIEFPGNEAIEVCLGKYRGNFGRLLVYVYRDGVDFQETMIREGYSPYFVKYGNAEFVSHHQRYQQAERSAQRQRLGVWNQVEVNGSEMRNYATLGVWWQLRARIIDQYRQLKAIDDSVLNPRLDYAVLQPQAVAGDRATVFTEVRSIERIAGKSGLIKIGSNQQPFSLFIPDLDSESGREIVNLLETRYISADDAHPKRSYLYVTGELSVFRDRPQMMLHSAAQITDQVAPRHDRQTPVQLTIRAILPNPPGPDRGLEQVVLHNAGNKSVKLSGWSIVDRSGRQMLLKGSVKSGEAKEIKIPAGQLTLNNTGDDLFLLDAAGKVQHQVTYTAADVQVGQMIEFA